MCYTHDGDDGAGGSSSSAEGSGGGAGGSSGGAGDSGIGAGDSNADGSAKDPDGDSSDEEDTDGEIAPRAIKMPGRMAPPALLRGVMARLVDPPLLSSSSSSSSSSSLVSGSSDEEEDFKADRQVLHYMTMLLDELFQSQAISIFMHIVSCIRILRSFIQIFHAVLQAWACHLWVHVNHQHHHHYHHHHHHQTLVDLPIPCPTCPLMTCILK